MRGKTQRQRYGNLQEYLFLQDVRGPVLCLKDGRYRSVIEVGGTYLNLLDEDKQQELYELYHRFFLSLDFPLQMCIRIRPLNISAYLQYIDPGGVGELTQQWHLLAKDHALFLRKLTEQRPILGRRFYIVLPAEDVPLASRRLVPSREQPQEAMSLEQAGQHLRTRYESLVYHLQAIGLSCRLLVEKELRQFYLSFFGSNRPQTMTVQRDHLQIEDHERHIAYIRVQQVERMPRLVAFGWLKSLIEYQEPLDIVHHINPRPPEQTLSYLRRQQAHSHASALYSAQTGRTNDPYSTIAGNDLAPLVEQLASGEQTMLDSSLHLIIRANDLDDLERKTQRLARRVTSTFAQRPRTCSFEQSSAFRACLPGHVMAGRNPLLLPSSAMTTMIPFFDHAVLKPSPTAILEGMTQYNEPVILDWWNDLTNANRLIIGPSGWGKSFKAKLDMLHLFYMYKRLAATAQHHQQQQQREGGDGFQILIIDPERETNRAPGFSLIERLGGQSVRFSPGSMHRLNPLDLPPVNDAMTEADNKEDLLANHVQRLHRIFDCMLAFNVEDKESSLTPAEKSLLDAALYTCYREAGISPDRTTHKRPAPLLADLHRVLSSEVCGPDPTGLAQRLRRYVDGSLSGLFSGPTNVRLDNTVIQFDVRDLESEQLRAVTLMMISNLVWNLSFGSSIPRFLFIDELATVGRYRAGQYFLEEVFQRARKHYLSVTGMTQEVSHLTTSIIANCASHILLHQDDTTLDVVADRFKLSSREITRVRGFDKGEALMLASGKRMMVRFLASPQEDKLITTNRRQIAALEAVAAAARK